MPAVAAPIRIRAFLFLACLVVSTALHAQVGTWQGTLPIPVKPRIIIKIAKASDGFLRSVFYRIDQDNSSIPFTTSTFGALGLTLKCDIIDIGFQGSLSPDGKSLIGIWTQDKKPYPLTLALTAPAAVWTHDNIVPLRAMSATADPAFEVATIKPSAPDARGTRYALRDRHFGATNETVGGLMRYAYKIRARQMSGGPAWLEQTRFDIAAEPDTEGQPSEDQYRLMLKKLLADRFHLKIHTIQQVFPVYALTLLKNAPALPVSNPDLNNRRGIFVRPAGDGEVSALFSFMDMREFCNVLMNFISERQIIDETGLEGNYDFTLTAPASAIQGSDDNDKASAFFTAIQPLGFKLVPKKAPLDVYVIDNLEAPAPN